MKVNMKKIFHLALLLSLAIGGFTACEDDNDSNPTLVETQEFVLNKPAYSGEMYDLKRSTGLHLTWSQPAVTDLNAPLAMAGVSAYSIQLSMNGNFTTSVEQAAADETGATIADYITLDETYSACEADLNAASVAKALMKLNKWAEDAVPASTSVYVRIFAHFRGLNVAAAPGVKVASNTVQLNVAPYYIELRDAAIELWYLVGSYMADGSWTNNAGAIGKGNVPMFPIEGYDYDKVTGKGMVSYTDYFPADAKFKMLPTSFNWDYAFMNGGSAGTAKYRDGGNDDGDITVPEAGYYAIEVNTIKNTCEIKKLETTSAPTYDKIGLIGLNGDWDNDVVMTAVNTKNSENHIWTCDIDVPANTKAKFRANGAWDTNWGKGSFPFGMGTQGGADIPVAKGSYKVFFNDITGDYNFILK